MDKSTNVRATRSKTSRRSNNKHARVIKHVLNRPRVIIKDKIEKTVSNSEINVKKTNSDSTASRSRPSQLVAIEYDASKKRWILQESENIAPLPLPRTPRRTGVLQSDVEDQGENQEDTNDTVTEAEATDTEDTSIVASPGSRTEHVGFTDGGTDRNSSDTKRRDPTIHHSNGTPATKLKKAHVRQRDNSKKTTEPQKAKSLSESSSHADLMGESKESGVKRNAKSIFEDRNNNNTVNSMMEEDTEWEEKSTSDEAEKAGLNGSDDKKVSSSEAEGGNDDWDESDATYSEGLADADKYNRTASTSQSNWSYPPSTFNDHPSMHLPWYSTMYELFNRPSWDSSPYNPACRRPAWDAQLYAEAKERYRRHESIKFNSKFKLPWLPSTMRNHAAPGTTQPPIYDMFRLQSQRSYNQYYSPQKMFRTNNIGQLSNGVSKSVLQKHSFFKEAQQSRQMAGARRYTNTREENIAHPIKSTWISPPAANPDDPAKGATSAIIYNATSENSKNLKDKSESVTISQGVQTADVMYGDPRRLLLGLSSKDSSFTASKDPSENPSRVASFSRNREYWSAWRQVQDDHRRRVREERMAERRVITPEKPASLSPLPRVALISKPNSRVARSGNGGYYSPSMIVTSHTYDENGLVKPKWDPSPFVATGKKNAWDDYEPKGEFYRFQNF